MNESTPESRQWQTVINRILQVPHRYTVLVSLQYVGIYHLVMARSELVRSGQVKDARSQSAGCGILGLLGNKGAVAVSLKVHNDTLCFVCSHLAAGHSQVDRRNTDVAQINQRITFTRSSNLGVRECDVEEAKADLAEKAVQREGSSNGSKLWKQEEAAPVALINDHDFAFWFGDLNYRIDLPREDVICKINGGAFAELYEQDQLRKQMAAGKVLVGFQEERPDFVPTYKYDVGTDTFDTSEKARTPAWCDRVLWRCSRPSACVQTSFFRHEIQLSDHRPVSATYELQVRRVMKDRLLAVAKDVTKLLDDAVNECIPSCSVDSNEVHFENVAYRVRQVCGRMHMRACVQALHSLGNRFIGELMVYGVVQSKVLSINNDGNVVAHFRFIPKHAEARSGGAIRVSKPW